MARGEMGRTGTMLRPWRTRISLHTLPSFPFTFFFGIALSAAEYLEETEESVDSVLHVRVVRARSRSATLTRW